MDNKIYLFSKPFEKILLSFQCILILLFISSFIFPNYNNMYSSNIANLILGYVFLNTFHTFFIFILILFLPEFRKIIILKLKTKWIFFFTLFTSLGFAGAIFSQFNFSLAPNILFILTVTFGILESTHNISQTKGISLLFNKKLKNKLDNKLDILKFNLVENIERKLFLTLILVQIFGFCFKAFGSNISNFKPILILYIITTLSLGSLIFLNSFRYPKIFLSNKRQYLSNIFLGALTPVYTPASWLYRSLHGLEYMLLVKIFFKNSIFKSSYFKLTMIFLILSMLLVLTLLSHGHIEYFNYKLIKNYWPYILIFSYLRQYFHFYLDSQLFKFNDPIIKRELKNII